MPLRRVLAAIVLLALGAAGGWLSARRHQPTPRPADPDPFALAEWSRLRGDYNGARNGYLQVLARDGSSVDARSRLFDITLAIGARDEAAHHLEKLSALLGPADERVSARKSALATPPPPPARLPGR